MYVPEKYYVGFQSQGDDSLVGFFTPDDGDDKSKKRKQTVDGWSDAKLKSKSTTITNDPRTGFRIVDTARRYRTNNVLFRILHPEVGAEFEISAENLNDLHQQCIIEYGEIKTELLFVRNGQNNILVVKDSDEHKNALKAMEVEKAKKAAIATINKKDIVVGSMLDIPYQGKVTYLGKHTVSYIKTKSERYTQHYASSFEVGGTDDKYLVFLDKGSASNSLILRKSWPKIEKLHSEKDDNLDIEEALKVVRRVYSGAYDSEDVYHVVLDDVLNPDDYEITFEESKKYTMNNLKDWGYSSYRYGLLADGSFYLAYPRNSYVNNAYVMTIKYEETHKAHGLNVISAKNPGVGGNRWGYGSNHEIQVTDPNTKFYSLRITKKKEQE